MAAEIKKGLPGAEVELVGESDNLGMFQVVAGGEQLWSKHETGSFPEPADIIARLPVS